MTAEPRAGRPRASSRETLADAACELFLERGYEPTSILDIARRAGVSRSSFFNYFTSKADIFWSGLDERIVRLENQLRESEGVDAAADARAAVLALGSEFAPDTLALGLVNATAMGMADELESEASLRRSRIARAVSERLQRGGVDRLRADVVGAAYGGAVLGALDGWAREGAGRTSLPRVLETAVSVVNDLSQPGRQAAASTRVNS